MRGGDGLAPRSPRDTPPVEVSRGSPGKRGVLRFASMRTHEPWPFPDTSGLPTWDQRVLALLPSGVDETQIAEDLKLSPTERLLKLQALVESVEALKGCR